MDVSSKTFHNILKQKQLLLKRLLEKYRKFSSIDIIKKVRKEIEFLKKIIEYESKYDDNYFYISYKRRIELFKQLSCSTSALEKSTIFQKINETQNEELQYTLDKSKIEHLEKIKQTIKCFESQLDEFPKYIGTVNKLKKAYDDYLSKHNLYIYLKKPILLKENKEDDEQYIKVLSKIQNERRPKNNFLFIV